MENWKRVKLGEYIKEINERTTVNNQYELLTSSKNGIFSQEEYFDKQVASKNNIGYKIIKKGQFTYRSMSDSGRFTINRLENKEIGIVSPAYPVFEAIKIEPLYLKYYFDSEIFKKAINNLSQGSTRTALKYKDLVNIELWLPSIQEQEKIVKILETVDSIIDKYKILLNGKEQFIKSQFAEIFGNLDINSKNYKMVKLSEISEYWNGLTYSPSDLDDDGTIVLRSSNIQNNKLDFNDIVKVSCEIKDKNYVKNNDILMCSRNGSVNLVGKVAMIEDIKEPMCFGTFMMIIRSKYYRYLFYYFQDKSFRRNISLETTTQINQITVNMLNKIKIPLPNNTEIENYSRIVQIIDKQKLKIEKIIENYENLKKGLMQQLLTGKVKINDKI